MNKKSKCQVRFFTSLKTFAFEEVTMKKSQYAAECTSVAFMV
jgi:hypothetical protein